MDHMAAISIVFPHQLFAQHPALHPQRPVLLVEESLFFTQYPFHQQKITLHRASMQYYRQWLLQQGYQLHSYVAATEPTHDVRQLLPALAASGVTELHLCDPTDDWLRRRLTKAASQHQLTLHWYDNPNFMTALPAAHQFFNGRKTYFQTDFYIWQRKRLGLLLEPTGAPLGGKWTYDTDNRERYPKGKQPPPLQWPAPNRFWQEAIQYVSTHFSHHYGQPSLQSYPCTHAQASQWLDEFLQYRFAEFGVYEDAMVQHEHYLHHSVLTPMLNIGLLQPQEVLQKTLDFAAAHTIPLNSLEGFVRQIVGWREFIRVVYEREGRRQRTRNYWGFERRIPASFYSGSTGIVPVDVVIKKLLQTGYNHHIERLMVLGNFMLLCEFDPDEVYRWFMEMYIDAYDWVMVPNVYGMTQFADGGLMTTKPYISGSNYLMKMGDWPKGEWQAIWDGLFWRFMHVHRHFFTQNPRLSMLVKTFDKMSPSKQQQHLHTAEQFLAQLDANL